MNDNERRHALAADTDQITRHDTPSRGSRRLRWQRIDAAARVVRTFGRWEGATLGAIVLQAEDPRTALRRIRNPDWGTLEEADAAAVLLVELERHERFIRTLVAVSEGGRE